MSKTKIEWTQHSWNPVTGCTPVSEGCTNCYACRMAKRLAGRCGYPESPHEFDVTMHPNRLEQPLHRRKPTIYFVCSMGDLFHKDIKDSTIAEITGVMVAAFWHTFQILTKRTERLRQLWTDEAFKCSVTTHTLRHNPVTPFENLDWPPPNVWVGVTAESQRCADERIPILTQTPAMVRFVSIEPMLGSIDLRQCKAIQDVYGGGYEYEPTDIISNIDWIICGGETGPGARPTHPEWARSLRDQCRTANVPFFFKQHGAWLHESQMTEDRANHARIGKAYNDDRIHEWDDGTISVRIGKKATGRLLDSKLWGQYPQAIRKAYS